MTQKNKILKSAGLLLAGSAFLLSVPSCIDDLYDFSNGISTDMVLGGDSLAIPIGSTDTIRLGDYLDSETSDMLKIMEDGGYAISKTDSIEPEIPVIDQSKLKIDDQIKTMSTPISFGNINLDNFKIPGVSVSQNVGLGFGSYSINNFTIPAISANTVTNAGMTGYALSNTKIDPINENADQNNLLEYSTLPPDPGGPPIVIPIPDPDPVSVSTTANMSFSVDVPGGITDVQNVELKDGAVFEVSLELSGASSTLNSGALVPGFSINPNGLFTFTNPLNGGTIQFSNADSLTKGNGFKVVKTYPISKLNVSGDPSDGKISIQKMISAIGSMALKNATVSSDKLGAVRQMDLLVHFSVRNLEISSMDFTISPISVTIPSSNTNISINNTLPQQIKKLNKVNFTNPSTITIQLAAENLPTMASSTLTLDQLSIIFPDEFDFEPAAGLTGHTYTVTNKNLKSMEPIVLTLKGMDMSSVPLSNGVLSWNGVIRYNGLASFGGRINSKDIPVSGDDARMKVNFSSSMGFESAEVTTNDIAVNVPEVSIPVPLDVDIDEQVRSLEVIKMKPDTKIRIDLNKPAFPLAFNADNMQITFPEMFVFTPPLVQNRLVLNGLIPDSIVLTLDALAINQNLTNGKLTLNEDIRVSGGVNLLQGNVNSKEIEGLSTKTLGVKATTSDLRISGTSITLKDQEFTTSDSIQIPMDINDVPEQVISLDSVMLKDNAQIQLNVSVLNMPDFGKPLDVNVVLNLPEMFIFEPGTVNSKNQYIIHDGIGPSGKLSKTIGLRGLKFDGKNLNGKLNINEKLKYNASVSITSPTVNSDDLVGKELSINVEAKIANIQFKSVYGKVDPKVDPVSQTVDIDGLEDIKDQDITLDVTKPVIVLKSECNLGIPINAFVKVLPVINNVPNQGVEQSFTLNLPKAPSPVDLMESSFWIAPDSVGKPAGSKFIKTRLQDVFRKIPDQIKLDASVGADMGQQHYFDLSADYKFKLNYEVSVPLAFGKDLNVNISKDISIDDPKIGEKSKAVGGIVLLGHIENSIPLEMNLKVVPLDEDGNRIAVDTVSQLINAGAHDGTATTSNITLKIKDPQGLLKDLRGFRLLFNATANETVAGTPIKTSNYVKADLKVRVDGGIKLKELLDNE